MDECLTMEQFRQNLAKTVNSCGLTVGAAYYVFKDMYNELRTLYEKEMANEKEAIENNTQIEDAEGIVGGAYKEGMEKETFVIGEENENE